MPQIGSSATPGKKPNKPEPPQPLEFGLGEGRFYKFEYDPETKKVTCTDKDGKEVENQTNEDFYKCVTAKYQEGFQNGTLAERQRVVGGLKAMFPTQ